MKKNLDTLKQEIAGKKLYIWGAMIVGQGVCRACERNGIAVDSFLDSNPAIQGQTALGYPILAPEALLGKHADAVILIASGHYDLDIENICIAQGLIKNTHYIMTRELNDIDPSIDISGTCNLHCISCPRGNMSEHETSGMMSQEMYQRVLGKLLDELPFLGSIQLYTWGEPLLNKNLPAIIAHTRKAHVLTAISSNLNAKADYEAVIKAKPDWFKISTSGFGPETYEVTHTGGKWSTFITNLHTVVELRDQYHPEMQIVLNYHLYSHNTGEPYQKMEALCVELGLIFRPSPAYLYPLDLVRDYIDGKPLPPQAEKTLELLMMDLDEGIQRASLRKELPCPEERCLPIGWDGAVRFCGVYYKPLIAKSILTTTVAEIMQKRLSSDFCRECKKVGLHQFTGVYLAEKRIAEGQK